MKNVFPIKSGESIVAVFLLTICMLMPTLVKGQEAKTTDQQAATASDNKVAWAGKLSNSGRHVTFASSAISSNPASSNAAAADPAPAPSSYNWSGFYIGGHAGYNWGKADTSFNPLPDAATFVNLLPVTLELRPKGFAGGVQGGYNWQKGHFVFGPEADFTWTDTKATVTRTPIPQNNNIPFPGAGFLTASQKTSYVGTFRLRGGLAFGRVLLYGTLGMAYGRVRYQADSDFRPVGTEHYPADFTDTKIGIVGGGGGEIGLAKHWSVKVEYLYYDLQKESATANPSIPFGPSAPAFQVQYRWKTQANTFNSGVNFRF